MVYKYINISNYNNLWELTYYFFVILIVHIDFLKFYIIFVNNNPFKI